MPKILENQLKRKGKEYFKCMNIITGSSEGMTKKPTVSLLKMYREQILPAIEEKVVRRFNNNVV